MADRAITPHDVRGVLGRGLRDRVAAARGDPAAPAAPGVAARRLLSRGFGLREDELDGVPIHRVATELARRSPALRAQIAGQVARQGEYQSDPVRHHTAAALLRAQDRRPQSTGGGPRPPKPEYAGTPEQFSREVSMHLAAALGENPSSERFGNAGADPRTGQPSLGAFSRYAQATPEMQRAIHQESQRAAAAAHAINPLSPSTVRGLLGSKRAAERALAGADRLNTPRA
jgi:hypothetical protein